MNKVKLSYLVRKSKTKTNGKAPIYLRIIVDEERKEISTKKDVIPTKWCTTRQRIKGNTPSINIANSYLDQLIRQAQDAETQLLKEGEEVTADSLKTKLLGSEKPRVEFVEFFELEIAKMKELIGNGYASNTHKRYKTCLKHFKSFLVQEYKTNKIPVGKIDLGLIRGFEHFLKTKPKPCNHNSSMKYIDHLKKVINIALDLGHIKDDPFKRYDSSYEPTDPVYLNPHELKSLESKDLPVTRIDKVRDVFLFCCYTGLAYVDVEKLTRYDVETDADGNKWLSIKRQKTKEPAYIMLLDVPLALLKKYDDHPKTEDGSLLPVISNQKTNAYLKEIAVLCNITKTLTFHVARHTFATTVALENGVPIDTVQKVLGHRDLRSTMHYAKVTKSKIGSDLRQLNAKLTA